jgi:hypothetical protein
MQHKCSEPLNLKFEFEDITQRHTLLDNEVNFINHAAVSVLHQNNTGDLKME